MTMTQLQTMILITSFMPNISVSQMAKMFKKLRAKGVIQ